MIARLRETIPPSGAGATASSAGSYAFGERVRPGFRQRSLQQEPNIDLPVRRFEHGERLFRIWREEVQIWGLIAEIPKAPINFEPQFLSTNEI